MSTCSHLSEDGRLIGNSGMCEGRYQVSGALDRRAVSEFKWVVTYLLDYFYLGIVI